VKEVNKFLVQQEKQLLPDYSPQQLSQAIKELIAKQIDGPSMSMDELEMISSMDSQPAPVKKQGTKRKEKEAKPTRHSDLEMKSENIMRNMASVNNP